MAHSFLRGAEKAGALATFRSDRRTSPAMSRGRRVVLRAGERWVYLLSLTMFAGIWTGFWILVSFAGDSKEGPGAGYYAFVSAGPFLAGAVAFWISRRSGLRSARSLLTAFGVAVISFVAPLLAIVAMLVSESA
jgi:hypothetical protein